MTQLTWMVTQFDTDHARTKEEILHNWHTGRPFKPYQYDGYVTVNDKVRMRIAGVTHLQFIYDREPPNMVLDSFILELK